ncbi:Guanine nucleotide exchange factor lte1 [Basidiobolus ranarum]|uniref:Guanine nucleotide exchange factor lte1 n=1 Tax=Basidiobolus ranarum TaxID=34480 RepID=A0ABR2W0W2_9FUNG
MGGRIRMDHSHKSSPLSAQIDEKENHFDGKNGFLPYYQALVRSISPNLLSVLERRRSKHSNSKHYIRVATIYGWISSPPDSPVKNTSNSLKGSTLKSTHSLQSSPVPKNKLRRLGWIFGNTRPKDDLELASEVEFGLWVDTLLPEKIAPLTSLCDNSSTPTKLKTQTSSKKLFLSGFKKDLSTKWDSDSELSRSSTNESIATPTEHSINVDDLKSLQPMLLMQKEIPFCEPVEQVDHENSEVAEPQKIQKNLSQKTNDKSMPELEDAPMWKEDSPEHVIYSINKAKSFLSKNEKVIVAGTIEKLVEKLTSESDYEFLSDFFMTYRSFMSPVQLCKTLGARFKWAINNEENGKLIQIRTYSAIRHWLTFYFDYDYVPSRALRFTMVNLLKDLQDQPQILDSQESLKYVTDLYECYKREKKNSMKRNNRNSTYDLSATKSFTSNLENKITSNLQVKLNTTVKSTSSNRIKKVSKSFENLEQSSVKAISCSNEKGRDASLWTMRMTCGLANLKERLPEVYNSIALGVNSDSIEVYEKSELVERTFAEDLSPLPDSPTRQTLETGGCSPRQSQQNLKSFILSYSTETIAQQFCIIEQRCLYAVEWHELIEVLWKDRSDVNAIKRCSGVLAQIDRFNMMSQWVATEIVTLKSIEERARVIEKLIRIAMRCYQHRNYSTLLQMVLGLQSSNISRLTRTWSKVGSHEKRMLEELKEFTSPCKNWKNIREAMQKASEDYKFLVWSKEPEEHLLSNSDGPVENEKNDCQMVGEACIPFFGLFLSDLTYNAELPSNVERATKSSDATTDSTMPSLGQDQPKLINFNKHRITASIIKRLLSFQSLCQRYPFRPDVSVFPKCVFIRYFEDSEIRQLSLECEK